MKYNELAQSIKLPFFSLQDLKLAGLKVFGYQLSLWQKRGHIIKLRNGVYVFADRQKDLSQEELSALLYSPSFISLEKALSTYGFIPEMAYACIALTPKTTRKFENQFGTFIFRHIKPPLYFGYQQITARGLPYLIADQEKALLDYVYFNRARIKGRSDLDEMRLNWNLIKTSISKAKLIQYAAKFNNKSFQAAFSLLRERI